MTRRVSIEAEVVEVMAIGDGKALIEATARTASGNIIRYTLTVPQDMFTEAATHIAEKRCMVRHIKR